MAWRLRFSKGIFDKIFGEGGEDRGRNLQPGGRIRPHRPVADLKNTTINERTRGRGLKGRLDGVAPSFFEGDF